MVLFHIYVSLPEGNFGEFYGFFGVITSGRWCNNNLEKYEFVNGKDDIPYQMGNKKCLKPPTSNML